MINSDLSLSFKVTPDPLSDGSAATAGLTADERMFLGVTGGDVFLHRVVQKEHVNTEYGSVGHDNAVELGTFPGLQDAGATADVQDWQGQPIQVAKLRLIMVRVQPLVEFEPAFAEAVLTSTGTIPTDGDTVTIGSKTYTAKTTLTPTEGQVLIGGSASAFLLNLSRAILHTGTPGTHYSCVAAHPEVSADATVTTSGSTYYIGLTALVGGTGGNSLVTTTTALSLSFGSGALAGGATVASPAVRKTLNGTVTVVFAGGVLPGGASAESKVLFDKPGYHIVAMDGDWEPEAGSSISIAFDAVVPALPAEVNAIATLLLIGNAS